MLLSVVVGRVPIVNSRKHGDLGLVEAIRYFTVSGYTVCLPLSDSQRFDLVVVKDGCCQRVEVKHSSRRERNAYRVELRTKGGNKSGETVTKFSGFDADLLFVLTPDGSWVIPTDEMHGRSILCLGESRYPEWRVA